MCESKEIDLEGYQNGLVSFAFLIMSTPAIDPHATRIRQDRNTLVVLAYFDYVGVCTFSLSLYFGYFHFLFLFISLSLSPSCSF